MRHSLLALSVLTLVAALPLAAAAQAPPDLASKLAAIEKAVDAKRDELHIPGISLAIVKDDKVIYCRGLGLRNIERDQPVTTKTQFAIGSSTKAFTAMTMMMAADEGKLALTDSPKKYLPYFKINDPEIDSKITISDLLSHRSGLERTDIAWYTGKLSPREIIEVAGTAKPTAKLGQKWQYQNVMFLAAGEIVAAVEKKPWQKVVAERIFKPLGMKTTNTDIVDMHRRPDYAQGYQWDAENKRYLVLPAREIRCIAPAGAINSNAVEMAQWVRLMLDGGVYEGKRLVSEKSFAALTVPRITVAPNFEYGYGWMLHKWGDHKIVEHGGNIDGFNAEVALMPDQHLGFVLLTNVSASSLGSFTMNTVWENLVGGGPKTPAPSLGAGGPAADPAKEVGTYKIAAAPVSLDISLKDGKLALRAPGQPAYPMEPLGGRKYKLGSPAPDGFFVTFRSAKDKPDETEMFLEQPQGNVVATREENKFQAPITVDELMRKVVEARGGEANLRKHQTVTLRYSLNAETQGVTGDGVEEWRAPDSHVDEVHLAALRKRIATVRDCFDGKAGSDELSFAVSAAKSGKSLANAAAEASFAPELDWQHRYKSVAITGMEKVEGDECYIVEKQVDHGDKFVDHVSSKTFLVLKTTGPEGSSETYRDYRDVNGIKISFQRERVAGGLGKLTITVKEVRFDTRIAASAFRPRVRSAAPTTTGDRSATRFTGYE